MLDFITQAIELLIHPPGDLVYYLIILFAIEALLGLAVVRARRTGWTRQLRLILLAAGVMLIGRAVLMVIALLSQQSARPDVLLAGALLPPLERYLDLLNLTFLGLAFVPLLRDRGQLGPGLTAIMLVAATIFYALSATQWYNLSAVPNQLYGLTPAETIWQAWSLAVAVLAALAVWLRRDDSAGVIFIAFLMLAAGSGLQLIWGTPHSNVAGWVRLAQLIAYPLFAVVVYQLTEVAVTPQRSAPHTYPLLPARSEAADQAWLTLTTIQNLSTSGELTDSLQRTAAALAQFLQADLCAIGLLRKDSNAVDLLAVYHPGAAPARGVTLALDRHPMIQRALQTRDALQVGKDDVPSEIRNLYGLLGSFIVGPTIIAPLVDDRNPLGVVLLGNPDSGRGWSPADTEHAQTLVDHMTLMLTARENRQYFAKRVEELETSLRQQELEATQRRATLESLLQQSQTEAQKTAVKLSSLVALQEAQQGSEREQIQQLQAERTRLQHQTQDYQTELSNLIQLQSAMEVQLKQAQQDMARLQDQQQRTAPAAAPTDHGHNGQQTEVIASIAQELRTPMTSIAGYTDLLLGESVGILGAMQRQFLQRVKANVARMEGMLSDLVQITTIDTGQIKLEAAPIDVPELLKDAVMATSTLFREREQSIRLELADHLPKLHTDRESLQQILQHLLSNAALCSPNQAEVVVRAQVPVEMSDYMLFSATDQGGGISLEDRQRAFHRMYRADHPLVQGLGETGVGLSIAKALVEAQGGRIWVDSEMGRGSTFTFILPLQPLPSEA
ncbi:Sensor histidine kinase WalK [Thermoflexales bacterium]|nr:Sensor histidine kinase WalK [Thermoflexales bacterium]